MEWLRIQLPLEKLQRQEAQLLHLFLIPFRDAGFVGIASISLPAPNADMSFATNAFEWLLVELASVPLAGKRSPSSNSCAYTSDL